MVGSGSGPLITDRQPTLSESPPTGPGLFPEVERKGVLVGGTQVVPVFPNKAPQTDGPHD